MLIMVLGQLPPRKIASNPKTNPNPNRGAIFPRGNCPDSFLYSEKNRKLENLGGNCQLMDQPSFATYFRCEMGIFLMIA